jgi:putative transposase
MVLSQSALSELLDAFRAGDGAELIRDAVRLVLQELIELEASERIGAARYERAESRVTDRNGARPRLLSTQAGDVELRIPKLRKGSFFPAILEPRRRIDQALYAVVMEAYVHGISTRGVDDLVEAMGVDAGISKSEVSRICAGLDEIVGAFRTRTLGHVEFPYVYLDATYLHVRNGTGQVVSMAVIVATGIAADGSREILGLDVGDSEDETFWRGFLTSLKQRGLSGVRLVISDQHAGLVKALKRCFQGAGHQRCRVHFCKGTCSPTSARQGRHGRQHVAHRASSSPARKPCTPPGTNCVTGLAESFPKIGLADGRRENRSARLHHLPESALAKAVVDQSAGADQQGDQTPLPRRRHLPQRRRGHPPRRRRAGRHARRMASRRAPLPLRQLHGAALSRAR